MEERDDVSSSGHGCEDGVDDDDVICSPPSGGVAAVKLFSCRGGDDDLAVGKDILTFFSIQLSTSSGGMVVVVDA
eukprot:scaffold4432_cov108-Skeletonema_dohrnii-CCMP3373.AAC.5